jgi:membrane protein
MPLLILVLIALAHVIDEARLLATLREYLEFVVSAAMAASPPEYCGS